ncbi:MAG TPA: copper resistance protein CopC [Dehalococcoidia bacterium]|nr:copper resistance protein CopC [Dehalococcoidia bacterium]
MHRAKLLILLAAFAAFGSLSLAGVVEAHSRPVRFDPAPGAVLTAAPSEVTGWFTSDIRRAEESFIQVLDEGGANVATGEVQLSADRRQISVSLGTGAGEGRYIVHWSTFDDADGEVFSGCYAFFVAQAAADAAVSNGEALDGGADCPAPPEAPAHGNGAATESSASVDVSVSVSGNDAELTILPVNFTSRPPDGSTVDPNFGHYHIYLDKVPVDVIAGTHSHDDATTDDHDEDMAGDDMSEDEMTGQEEMDGGLVENPVMWVENSFTFTGLEPGVHTVSVVLNYDNHTPLNPPVIASHSFTISGAGGGDGGIPAWTLALAIAGGLVVGGVGMKLAGGRG